MKVRKRTGREKTSSILVAIQKGFLVSGARKGNIVKIILTFLVAILAWGQLAWAGERQLYDQLKKVEAATTVGVNAIELKKLLYPAAKEVSDMGMSIEEAKKHADNPRPKDYLMLAFELYRGSSSLMIEGSLYKDRVQKSWSIASSMLSKYKNGRK